MKEGTIFILFGATGDLVKRKLIPAIYDLHSNGEKIKIIGIARRQSNPEKLINASKKYISNYNKKTLNEIKNNMSYIQMDFLNSEKYKLIKKELRKIGYTRKLFHLSTMSENFEKISENLKKINCI